MSKQMKVSDYEFSFENGGFNCCAADIYDNHDPCKEGDVLSCSECGIRMILKRGVKGTLVWMAV